MPHKDFQIKTYSQIILNKNKKKDSFEKKTARHYIRLTPSMNTTITALSDGLGITKAEVIRLCIAFALSTLLLGNN